MKNLKQSLATQGTYWLKVISLGIILGIGIQFAQAWTNPGATPPGGNVAGPITTGAGNQVKSAGLGLTGNLVVGLKAFSASTVAGDVGTTLVTKDYVDGRLLQIPCTSFTYTEWTPVVCTTGIQTRTVLTSSPLHCTGGTPITSQVCILPAFVFTKTISNVANYNLRSDLLASGWDGVQRVEATITTTGTISSANTSTPAFSSGSVYPSGSTIRIINNGYIVGAGGKGGYSSSVAGGAGGTAISIQTPVIIENNGVIGGGGGGGSGYYSSGDHIGCGGGGAGAVVGPKGGVFAQCNYHGTQSLTGSDGTLTTGGAGPNTMAGSGGDLGKNGSLGNGLRPYSPAGAAGRAVDGNSLITWGKAGDIRGPLF